MADPPNMSLSETISVAIQGTKSHIAHLKARQIEAEKFAQTLESTLRVIDAQKSRLELISIFRLILLTSL
jgi:CRISPR/Cas system CSM-associated protein Csm2 small subunit